MRTIQPDRATLALADGTLVHGTSVGAPGTTVAELVLNTAMTGYQEILTDPSYTGQFVVFTAPHIGNVGVAAPDSESPSLKAAGLVVREMARCVSNHRAMASLPETLREQGLVAISDVDTRAIVRRIRDKGAMNAVISTDHHTWDALEPFLNDAPSMEGQHLVDMHGAAYHVEPTGSTIKDEPIPEGVDCSDGSPHGVIPDQPYRVALVDFGAKATIESLLATAGCAIDVVPASTDPQTLIDGQFDGVMLSNGPGDPAVLDDAVVLVQTVLGAKIPVFGICLGHQLLALAGGARTYKMHHGHHGGNHPVRNLVADTLATLTDPGPWLPLLARDHIAVEITSQNHGFAVDTETLGSGPYGRVIQTHINLTDGTNSGIAFLDRPAFGVQYHPESAPGPHDSRYLFDQFTALMARHRATIQEAKDA
ncbi:glutamine-hydrolyzing carbamoyl-phosphate synthase small subunit [Stomatohabitans albus]|uniref:glutamine-hydrolyzing carbamoyl-phosphate synthase small subunit n=1 Tax=Stomatohabitans albus TaxID=3110766 RepID=UPI00300CFAED